MASAVTALPPSKSRKIAVAASPRAPASSPISRGPHPFFEVTVKGEQFRAAAKLSSARVMGLFAVGGPYMRLAGEEVPLKVSKESLAGLGDTPESRECALDAGIQAWLTGATELPANTKAELEAVKASLQMEATGWGAEVQALAALRFFIVHRDDVEEMIENLLDAVEGGGSRTEPLVDPVMNMRDVFNEAVKLKCFRRALKTLLAGEARDPSSRNFFDFSELGDDCLSTYTCDELYVPRTDDSEDEEEEDS
jgi:hypothetical protein